MKSVRIPAPVALALGLILGGVTPTAAQTLTEGLLANLEYREIGPTRQSGRFVDIAVPSDDPHTFYIATASGHLWKTTNRGISFEVLFDDQPDVFSIGAIAVAPSDSDVLYLGSGEANNSRSSYWGNGVYKSTDAGATWTNVGLPESHHIGRIVVHPTDPDVVYVASLGPLYSEGGQRGLYRSDDGGESWEQLLAPEVEGRTIGVVDVVMDPTDPQTLYAASYDKVRLPFTFDLGGPGSRLWKTSDGGESWIQIGQGLPEGMLGRIGVDVYQRDPNILYVTIENANKEGLSDEERRAELLAHQSSQGMIGGEVYRSDDAGLTWTKVSPDGESIGGGPAYYYGQIIIDPNDPAVVHVLSAASWGTYDGGQTWERRPLGFGGDDHALWINPDDSRHMILGYDHGMGITYDGGENWYHPDFQSLAQFYAVGIDQSFPYRVAGGLQDNGSHMTYHTNPSGDPIYFEAWERVGGGDGMYNEFDWCENRYLYNESQFGPLRRTDLLTGESKMIRYEDDEMRYNWNAPILVSPHDCDVVYHAGNRLMRSDFRGESWQVISPDLSKNDPATLTTGKGGDGNIQYGTITTIDESPLKAGVIWVGTDDGNVQLTQDGGETWTLLNANIPGNPEYWVSRVEASHHDLGTAYVSFTGYRNDDFRPFVYKTTDFGATWTSIAGGLPDGPVNVVREHHRNPDLLFLGTEFQVWVSNTGGEEWVSMKLDMPTSPVHDLKIHERDDDLVVATHGRGIFIADIAPLAELTPDVLAQDVHLFQPEPEIRWVASDRTNYAFSNFAGESEASGASLYFYLREAAPVTLTVFQGQLPVRTIQAEGTAGINVAQWDLQKWIERAPEEQERLRAEQEESRGGGRRGGPSAEDRARYAISDAAPGEYRVVLSVDGETRERMVRVLRDEWWQERR
ncbi:MAG: glycosyl hydrolase [Gemmatimonas sp. SG8_23]|nr:MAG: glycosyl hydrolase [Gemmatimonas sp. SG8_23]